jgi:DNA (cytosine-5)-methyltransferase 1
MRDQPTSELTRGDNAHSQQRFVSHHGQTHLDLFSGIGGFAIAAAANGFKTIGFSETDSYATKILKRHWPDVPNYGDVRNVRGVRADLVTGGFPCQPFSLAGRRAGANDDRALWPEMLRVIDEARPSWVLGENVPGIITMELDRVLADLENLGYACWPVVVPACAVGARHRRDRVWIVGYSERERSLAAQRRNVDGEILHQVERPESADSARRPSCDVPNSESCRRNERHPHAGRNGEGTTAPEERSRPADYCWWPAEPGMGRVADGIPNRSHRLKGLGNAIVPQVASEILKNLVMANEKS